VSEFPSIEPPDRDSETARLLVRGDQEGLRRLLVDHGGKVKALLRKEFSKVLDLQEIDDVASQASVRAWRSAGTFDLRRGSIGAWFFAIARNCALRYLETKRRTAPFALVENLDSTAAAAQASLTGAAAPAGELGELGEASDLRAASGFLKDVRACIDALPPQQRDVMLADLRAGGTANAAELAAQLHTTKNSVYVSRTNGRKALRAAMQKRGHHLDPQTGEALGGWT
jgi:RNA polymerase sigma factor (sigma-70 family)